MEVVQHISNAHYITVWILELCTGSILVRSSLQSQIVLATGPNCRVSSGFGSTRTRTVAMDLTTRKTWTIGNGAVLPPKTRHSKFTILAPIKNLSSDCIRTWSVRRLCSVTPSFTSSLQICDPTSICWIANENLTISLKIRHYFTTTQRISVGLQIWMQEVKAGLKLNNLYIGYVMIRLQLIYLIGAQGVGTVYLEPQSGSNPAKYPRFYVQSR
jgi:hypothetical protein